MPVRLKLALAEARGLSYSRQLCDDEFTNSPVVSRLFQVEAAHHCAVFESHAGFTEPAVHKRGDESVYSYFPGPKEAGRQQMGRSGAGSRYARGGHAEMHSRRGQAQRSG